MAFLSERSKDNRDQGVGGPSLKTPNEGPGSKLQKEINLEDFKLNPIEHLR